MCEVEDWILRSRVVRECCCMMNEWVLGRWCEVWIVWGLEENDVVVMNEEGGEEGNLGDKFCDNIVRWWFWVFWMLFVLLGVYYCGFRLWFWLFVVWNLMLFYYVFCRVGLFFMIGVFFFVSYWKLNDGLSWYGMVLLLLGGFRLYCL